MASSPEWWWLEYPLTGIYTTFAPNQQISALSLSWVRNNRERTDSIQLRIVVWLSISHHESPLFPFHTFYINESESLHDLLIRIRKEHMGDLSPTTDELVSATNQITRFILAGAAWMTQRIVVDEPAHIEMPFKEPTPKIFMVNR